MSFPTPQTLPFEQPQAPKSLPFEQDSTITISGIAMPARMDKVGVVAPEMRPKEASYWFDQQSDGSVNMVVDTQLESGATKHDVYPDVEHSDDVHRLASFYKWRDSEAQPVTGRGMRPDSYYIDLAYHKILAQSNTATKIGANMFNVLNSMTLGGFKAALDKFAPGSEHSQVARLAEAENVRDEYVPIARDDWKNRVRRVIEGEETAASGSLPFIFGGEAVAATGIGRSVGVGITKQFPIVSRVASQALKLGKVAEKQIPEVLAHGFDSALTFGGLDAYSELVNNGSINPKKLVAAVVTGGYFPTFSRMVSEVYSIPARREALAQALKGIIGVSAVTTPQVIVDTAATIQDEKKVDFLTALGMAAKKFGQDPKPLIENAFTMSIFAASGAFDRFTKSTQTRVELSSILEKAANGDLSKAEADKLTKLISQAIPSKSPTPVAKGASADFGDLKSGDMVTNKFGGIFQVAGFNDKGNLTAKSLASGNEVTITKEAFAGAGFRKAEDLQAPQEPPKIPISEGVKNEGGISKEGTPEKTPPPISMEEPRGIKSGVQGTSEGDQAKVDNQYIKKLVDDIIYRRSPVPMIGTVGFVSDLTTPEAINKAKKIIGKKEFDSQVSNMVSRHELLVKDVHDEWVRNGSKGEEPYSALDKAGDIEQFARGIVDKSRVQSTVSRSSFESLSDPKVVEQISQDRPVFAVKLKDGSIIADENWRIHTDAFSGTYSLSKELQSQVVESGFISKGKYVVKTTEGGGTAKSIIDKNIASLPDLVKRTSQEILSSLSDNAKTTISEATKGLTDLFGGEGLKSFPGGIDEETYAKAKPHFEKAWASLKSAGKDFSDLVSVLVSEFGEKIRPYLDKFIGERVSKVPEFKSSEEAIAYGRSHTDMVPELEHLASESAEVVKKLIKAEEFEKVYKEGVRKQLFVEAAEFARNPKQLDPFEKLHAEQSPFMRYLQDIVSGEEVPVYHGTDVERDVLNKGDYVTLSKNVAEKYAQRRASREMIPYGATSEKRPGNVIETRASVPEGTLAYKRAVDFLQKIRSGELTLQEAEQKFHEPENEFPLSDTKEAWKRPNVGTDEYSKWFDSLTDAQKESEVNRRNAEEDLQNQPKAPEPVQVQQPNVPPQIEEVPTGDVESLKSSASLMSDLRSAIESARTPGEKGVDVATVIPSTEGSKVLGNLAVTLRAGLEQVQARYDKAVSAKKNPKIIDYLAKEVQKAKDALQQVEQQKIKPSASDAVAPYLDQVRASIHDNFTQLPQRSGAFTEKNLEAFYLTDAGLSSTEAAKVLGINDDAVRHRLSELWKFLDKPLTSMSLEEVANRKKILDLMYQWHPDYADFLQKVQELSKSGGKDFPVLSDQGIAKLYSEAKGERDQSVDLNESDSIDEAMGAALPTSVGTSPNVAEIQKLQSLQPIAEKNEPSFVSKTKADLGRAPEAFKNMLSESLDFGKKLWNKLTKAPDWSGGIGNNKRIFGEFLADLAKIDRESLALSNELRRLVPDDAVLEGMTKYARTGGDVNELTRLANPATWPSTLDPKLRDKAIAKYQAALQLTPDQQMLAREIRRYFDKKLLEGIDADVLETGVEDYVTRVWKKPNVVTQRLLSDLGSKKLQRNLAASHKRIFDTDFEGESLGYEPLTDNLADLVGIYAYSFGKAVASRAYVRRLLDPNMVASDGRPLAAITGGSNLREMNPDDVSSPTLVWPNAKAERIADYGKPANTAFKQWKWIGTDESGRAVLVQGDISIHPEIYKQVNNAFSSSEWMKYTPIRWLTEFQASAKGLKFSLSAFHYVQEATHALGHTVNPVSDLTKIDLDNPVQYALVSHSLMLNDRSALSQFSEGLAGGGWSFKIPVLGRGIIQPMTEHLFGEYIPRLKMTTALHILARNIDRYRSQISSGKISYDQVLEISASQANAAYGMLNYRWMGSNPTFRHFLRLALIAPDFLESRLRFAGQAMKPYGAEQVRALAILTGEIYVAGRVLNKLLDDDYHFGDPFTVYAGNRKYSIRSVPGDIYNLATDPGKFVSSRLSPFVQQIEELRTSKDWRGVQANYTDQARDLALRWWPVALTPQEGMKFYDGAWNALGLHKVRYSFDSEMKRLASNFNETLGVPVAKYPVEGKYSGLKRALEDEDMTGALNEYEKLLELSTRSEIDRGFEQSVTRPFTGSAENDHLFFKTLTKSETEKLQKAREEHKDMLKLFHQTVQRHLSLGKPEPVTLKALRKHEILNNH